MDTVRGRSATEVVLRVPDDVLESLIRVAKHRDMSVDALIRFYIGQGLRQDVTNLFSAQVFDATADVLAKHLESPEEVALILDEIREATGIRS
jgi:hypothetical protein